MSVNMETAIKHMESLKAKGIKYSMYGSRTGTDGTADCSGAVFASLRQGGAYNPGWVLNTDSMHAWLLNLGFKLIAQNKNWQMQRGDVVILGLKGSSGGAAGHTFIAYDNKYAIHCAYKSSTNNGMFIDLESIMPYYMGYYVYRLQGATPNPSPSNGLEWVESGTFKLTEDGVALRKDKKSTAALIARLNKGAVIKYDRAYKAPNDYIWIRQRRTDNTYAWIATGQTDKSNKRINSWGTFK